MDIRCEYVFTLYPKAGTITSSPFRIVRYKAANPVKLPNGTVTRDIAAKGNFLPENKGTSVILTGVFEEYKKTGSYTLSVESFEEEMPAEKEKCVEYLKTLSCIGPKTAERIYEKFGTDIFKILETEPEKLMQIKGISGDKVAKIKASHAKKSDARELFQFLYKFGVSERKVMDVYERFGAASVEIIKRNPYKIVEVNGISFLTADQIAQNMDEPVNPDERAKAAILFILQESENGGSMFNGRIPLTYEQDLMLSEKERKVMANTELFSVTGNTCLDADILYLQLLKLTAELISKDKFIDIIASMQGKSIVAVKKNCDGEEHLYVYRKPAYIAESRTAMMIAKRVAKGKTQIERIREVIRDSEWKLGMMLSVEQKNAVETAIVNPFAIITGGPGTGKTAVQKVILAVFEYLYPERRIQLIAPTGMAAKRMSESTGRPASTMHSALHITPDGITEPEMLDGDFILLDEVSMVDAFLMKTFLENTKPDAKICIIGDSDQLPSVAAGCVLKELLESGVVPSAKLTTVFRQADGSTVAVNAARIRIGETQLEKAPDFTVEEMPAEGSDSKAIAEKVKHLYRRLIAANGVDNVSVLTAYRQKTETGVDLLNPVLRNIANSENLSGDFMEIDGTKFYVNDKIMFTKNNGELVNGDIGFITGIRKLPYPTIEASFSQGDVTIEGDDLRCIKLAYATTVHKSQGAEYDTVIMVVDRAHKILLKRNLVYTGVTRAKKNMYLVVSDDETLANAITTEDSVKRSSLLASLVRKYCKQLAKEDEQQLTMEI